MSHSSETPSLSVERFDGPTARKYSSLGLVISVAGIIVSAIGYLKSPEQFAFSWLFAFMVVFTISVGALFWTILHTATDSEWGVLVRRQMENLASVINVLPLFFLPLFACAPTLWKWWNKAPGEDPLLDAKHGFLNQGFFSIRAIVYFATLGGVAYLLRSLSVKQDDDGAAKHTLLMRKVAIAGLPILGVSLTFAAVDWLMGLDYHWFSTMWGVYIFAGAAGSSMALLVLVISALRRSGYLKSVTVEHYHIMGKFLLAFTVFWAYIGYSQYMLIWYANIPEETIYFKIRNTESWHVLSTLMVVGRFFLPFPFLLFQASKKRVPILCGVAVWILLMQLLDIYVIVLPSLHQTGVSLSLYDISSLLAVVGAGIFVYFRKLASANLFPNRDPRLSGSVNLTN
ncbi:MAG: hypothetical protein WCO60_01315 [Verrucomicrobiota bacterium]